MQHLRLFFAMALLYMFRVTVPPIIRSTMLYMAIYSMYMENQYDGSIFKCELFLLQWKVK